MYEASEGSDIRDLRVQSLHFPDKQRWKVVDQRGSDRVESESELWICFTHSVLVFPCFNFLI